MADQINALKARKPAIGEFLASWRKNHEAVVRDLSTDEGINAFHAAADSLLRHIATQSYHATISTVVGKDGLETIYISARPKGGEQFP